MNDARIETPLPRTGIARWPFYYGWVNLGLAALAMVGTLPGRTQGLGLVTEPLMRDFGLDRVLFAHGGNARPEIEHGNPRRPSRLVVTGLFAARSSTDASRGLVISRSSSTRSASGHVPGGPTSGNMKSRGRGQSALRKR